MDRRAILSSGTWSPQNSGPLAWFYAAAQYVSLSGLSVAAWLDRSGNGNNLDQSTPASQPTWEASGGWSAPRPSVRLNAQSLNNSGAIVTRMSGTDLPLTVLCTCQVLSYTDANTICSWDDNVITARQNLTVTTSQFVSAKRVDDVGASVTQTASGPLVGTGHVRLAYVFTGTSISAYVDGVTALDSATMNVGLTSFARFRLGDGPEGPGADSLNGRIVEAIIYQRALGAAEVAAYYAYSLAEWG